MRYLMTHSLLASWHHALQGNPFEDMTTERDPMDEFMRTLRREPIPPTDAMQNGIDFENLVTAIIRGQSSGLEPWHDAAEKIATKLRGGVLQMRAYKEITVSGIPLLLYGRLDALKAGEITDIKFTKYYDPGKFFNSTQHPMYFELVPEANRFTYLASNGSAVWPETYRRDETRSIIPDIQDFFSWLATMDFMALHREKWATK